MKRCFFFSLLFCTAGLCAKDLTPDVQALAEKYAVLQGTSWAAAAADTNRKPVFSLQADLRLAPASTLKLITSAAALEAFGPMHRFETRIYADTQPDENGVLNGNIYVRGAGDPTLGSARVSGSLAWQELLSAWSKQIRQAGIRKINGHIYGDISLFDGPSLPLKTNWQNMGNYFAAPATALAFNDNSFKITFSAQSKHRELMRVKETTPVLEGITLRSFVTADAKNPKDEAYVYGAPGQYNMEIFGTLPTSIFKEYTISAALPDAPQALLDLWIKQLEKDGVSVSGEGSLLQEAPDYAPMTLLYTHYSPRLKDIIYIVNKRSFNFYAETLLRLLAVKNGKKGSVEEGLKAVQAFLRKAGADERNVILYDGSGLSRDNQLTVNTLLSVLTYTAKQDYFPYYYESLATPLDRGDLLLLRRFLGKEKSSEVRVKGGTIDGVKAQAGYVKTADGRLTAFAFIANNLLSKDEGINRFYEDLIKILLANQTPASADAEQQP